MERFTLILHSIPEEKASDFLAHLAELGERVSVDDLPAILVKGLTESEAKIRKDDIESFGAVVEMLPDLPSSGTSELPPDLDFDDLTKELDNELQLLKLEADSEEETVVPEPPAKKEPSKVGDSGLEFKLSFDEPEPVTESVGPVTSDPFQDLALNSSEIENAATNRVETPEKQIDLPPAKVESLPEQVSQSAPEPGPPPTASTQLPDAPVPKPAFKAPEAPVAPSPEDLHQSSDSSPDDQEEEEYDDWDEDYDAEQKGPSYIRPAILIGLLLCSVVSWLVFVNKPKEDDDNNGELVSALLDEQEKVIKEYRKQQLRERLAKREQGIEILEGEIDSGPLSGTIRFGRYSVGLLIQSLILGERERPKITPLDLANGLTPPPWLKSLELMIPGVQHRDPLGPTFRFEGDAFAYLEDEEGSQRILSRVLMNCNFGGGAKLNCEFRLRNKGTGFDKVESNVVERSEKLGFLILYDGEFLTELKEPSKPTPTSTFSP